MNLHWFLRSFDSVYGPHMPLCILTTAGHASDESAHGLLGESPDRPQLGHRSASEQPLEGLDVSEAWIHNVPWVLNLDNLNKIAI